jgi:hypothetical protein
MPHEFEASEMSDCCVTKMRLLFLLMPAMATASALADGPATMPVATASAPAPRPFLTLVPPPESSDVSLATRAAEAHFVPHPSSDISELLEEARSQPGGILPYGPVSLVDAHWKVATETLHDKLGLDLGTEMDMVFQAASHGPGNRDAGGGYWAIFGKWRLLGTSDGANNGYLKFKADTAWQIGDQAPHALGGQIDSVWPTTKGFGENSLAFAQLYWEQHFLDKAFVLVAGKIDPTNYYAKALWADDKQFFMNAAFSALPAVGIPGNGIGMNAKYSPTSWLYLTAGFQDQQASRNSSSVQTFFRDFDLFSAAEVGLTPKIAGLGQGHYSLTAWHADDVPDKNKPSDHGFVLSFDQAVSPHVIPFARYEYDSGDLTSLRQLLTGGIGFHGHFLSKLDVSGIAFGWGQPVNGDLRAQYTAETFYRIQLSPANQFSIGYQFIINPAYAEHDETAGVFWARFRILF